MGWILPRLTFINYQGLSPFTIKSPNLSLSLGHLRSESVCLFMKWAGLVLNI